MILRPYNDLVRETNYEEGRWDPGESTNKKRQNVQNRQKDREGIGGRRIQ